MQEFNLDYESANNKKNDLGINAFNLDNKDDEEEGGIAIEKRTVFNDFIEEIRKHTESQTNVYDKSAITLHGLLEKVSEEYDTKFAELKGVMVEKLLTILIIISHFSVSPLM